MRSLLKTKWIVALLACLFLLASCGNKRKTAGYTIGIDPSWYPLQITGQEKSILAFSIELLSEIAKKEHLQLAIATMNWDDLTQSLSNKKCDAILSSMPPYSFYLKNYSFSQLYLMTGPVIVTSPSSKIANINDLHGKEVGVVNHSTAGLILQKIPGILLKKFDSIPNTLVAVADQEVEAALVELLIAQDYVRNFYNGALKIASPPLNEDGLRLITEHNKNPGLIKSFNHGLELLKTSGKYDQLLRKWGLSPDSNSTAELEQQLAIFLESVSL